MKAKYIGCSDAQFNFGHGKDPRDYLEEGEVYDIVDVKVHSWHTVYYIQVSPSYSAPFNSVCFNLVGEGEETEKTHRIEPTLYRFATQEHRKEFEQLQAENEALRISESDSHQKAKEYFHEAAQAKESLKIARETVRQLQAELAKQGD